MSLRPGRMDAEHNHDRFESVRSKPAIIADLEALATEPGFIYSLAFMLRRDQFVDPEEAADINWRERLSYQEFSFLVGLMVKKPIDPTMPTEDQMQRHITSTHDLFQQLHDAHLAPAVLNNRRKLLGLDAAGDQPEFNFSESEFMTEPMFYGASGAYDFQFLEFANKRYQRQDS